MKRGVTKSLFVFAIVLILATSLVSAGWFSDLFVGKGNYITGDVTSGGISCMDSDGKNPFVKGNVVYGEEEFEDWCPTSIYLYEGYCDIENNVLTKKLIRCEGNDCVDGACVIGDGENYTGDGIECIDSDGGRNLSVKGTTSKEGRVTQVDRCLSDRSVWESFCDEDGDLIRESVVCEGSCVDGACVESGEGAGDTGELGDEVVIPSLIADNPGTPRIAYWWGKVNRHIDLARGIWVTDVDGHSGANLDALTYCQKFYPNTMEVKQYARETLNDWRERGNINSWTSTKMTYECVQGDGTGQDEECTIDTVLADCGTGFNCVAGDCVAEGMCSSDTDCELDEFCKESVGTCQSFFVEGFEGIWEPLYDFEFFDSLNLFEEIEDYNENYFLNCTNYEENDEAFELKSQLYFYANLDFQEDYSEGNSLSNLKEGLIGIGDNLNDFFLIKDLEDESNEQYAILGIGYSKKEYCYEIENDFGEEMSKWHYVGTISCNEELMMFQADSGECENLEECPDFCDINSQINCNEDSIIIEEGVKSEFCGEEIEIDSMDANRAKLNVNGVMINSFGKGSYFESDKYNYSIQNMLSSEKGEGRLYLNFKIKGVDNGLGGCSLNSDCEGDLICENGACVEGISATCDQGCFFWEKCFDVGDRFRGRYCNSDLDMVFQKRSSDKTGLAACENDYECNSNSCEEDVCTQLNILQKLVNTVKSIF